jgi:hypothetical protein
MGDAIDELRRLVDIGHVEHFISRGIAELANRIGQCFFGSTGDHDPRACGGHAPRDAKTESGSAAGDQRDLAIESKRISPGGHQHLSHSTVSATEEDVVMN